MIKTSITKIGASHYILIPSDLVEYMKIKNGSQATIKIENEKLLIEIEKA